MRPLKRNMMCGSSRFPFIFLNVTIILNTTYAVTSCTAIDKDFVCQSTISFQSCVENLFITDSFIYLLSYLFIYLVFHLFIYLSRHNLLLFFQSFNINGYISILIILCENPRCSLKGIVPLTNHTSMITTGLCLISE